MRILATILALAIASPALADTIHCESPGKTAVIDIDVAFTEERDTGTITHMRAQTENVVFSTVAEETGREADALAVDEVAYDRIEAGLASENTGPLTVRVDIVRTADFEPGEEAETGVVVAGVAYVGSVGTVTLLCTGW